ncbi:MAG TPA: tetratricopeptide repeat protein [Planctomycetota bacterium]|nr:tetratricopeptide repeat protein [Planctomycetota bacterium]
MNHRRSHALLIALASLLPMAYAGQATLELPPKAPSGFFQTLTPAFNVECNTTKAHADKVATMIKNAEMRFYQLFKLTPDLMNGTSKQKFDNKANIPGDVFAQMGFKPFIHVRVYKDMEGFTDEWFELTGVKDKEQRLRMGIPGAYFCTRQDYDKTKMLREIRSFVANRDDDELERTLLHEMGHLFMHSYLLAFFGDPPKGQESQKRGTPAWLSEGLAQLFEILWSKAGSAQKAKMRSEAMIYEATQNGDYYKFDEFVNITNAHNLAAVAGDPLKATLNYAQSLSVMDYMVNVDGARFFSFLENLRALNFERNLRTRNRDHIPELYSFQDEAFKKAFNCSIAEVEPFWKKSVKTKMEAALKKQPELNYWIGEYYLRRGKDKENDYIKAEERFKLAMTQAPTKGEGYLGMGRMQLRKNDHETALKTLTKAAELMPKDEDAWYFLGMAQINNGKLKEACESLDKALKIFPRSGRSLSGMATAQFHSNNFAKAAEYYEQAYLVTRNPGFMREKGRAAFFAKDYRLAQGAFAVFCEAYPKDPQGALWYGLSAWRLNDKEFGMKKLQEAKALNPNDPMITEAIRLAEKGESLRFELEETIAAEIKDPAKAAPKKVQITIEDE